MNDLISRQDAIDALQKEINKGIPPFDDTMGAIRCGVRLARNIIEDLPSAERTGKWSIEDCHAATYKYCCSNCKAHHRARYDFCPSCGCRMKEGGA